MGSGHQFEGDAKQRFMPDEADDREGLESQPSVLSTLDPMFKQNDGLGIGQTIHLHH